MKNKIVPMVVFGIFLLSLLSPLVAQEKVFIEKIGVKATPGKEMLGPDQYMNTESNQRERPRIVMYTSYVVDDEGYINHNLNLSQTSYIRFYVDYTAIYNTKVRFHFIISGPEYFEYTTSWYQAAYNKYYWLYLETNTNWQKGIYNVTVVAEQQTVGSGAECATNCTTEFY